MRTPLFAGSSVDQNGPGLPPHTGHGSDRKTGWTGGCGEEDPPGRTGRQTFRYLVFGMAFTLPLNLSQLLCVHCSYCEFIPYIK